MILRAKPIKRSPIKKRRPKRKPGFDNPAYRAWLKTWPCYVCFVHHCRKKWLNVEEMASAAFCRELFYEMRSRCDCGITEVAHVGVRGLGQRCKDRDALPLGSSHHRIGQDAAHVLGKKFWGHHGIEREEALEMLRRIYKEETGNDA